MKLLIEIFILMKKINIIDRIVLENLVLKTNLNLQPIKVLDKYIVHEGTVQKETLMNKDQYTYILIMILFGYVNRSCKTQKQKRTLLFLL